MPQENINQEFRLKAIDEIWIYLIHEITQTKLMTKKHKKSCRVLNYTDHSLIVISTITGWGSISAFASLEITISAIGLKICAINAGNKMYKSIVKKKNNNIITLHC